jgi:hypothetical protein
MNKKQRILVVIAIILITGTIGALLGYYYSDTLKNPIFRRDLDKDFDGNFSRPSPEEFRDEIEKGKENFETYVTIKSAVTLINIVIAVILIGMYLKIYREVKSDFTIGLIVVMFALLLYAITSNPFIQYLFTYRAFGQGPFILLPDIFATVALSVLLYLSLK